MINLDASNINLSWYGFVEEKKKKSLFLNTYIFHKKNLRKTCSSPNRERSLSLFCHYLSLSKLRCSSTKYKKAKWSKLSREYNKYYLTRLLIFLKFVLDRIFLFLSSLLGFISQYLTTAITANLACELWAAKSYTILIMGCKMLDALVRGQRHSYFLSTSLSVFISVYTRTKIWQVVFYLGMYLLYTWILGLWEHCKILTRKK